MAEFAKVAPDTKIRFLTDVPVFPTHHDVATPKSTHAPGDVPGCPLCQEYLAKLDIDIKVANRG